MKNFQWEITKKSSSCKARTGVIHTPHGKINTPAFIFCATKASLKTLNTDQIKNCGTQILLSNTYHLMLQPGGDIIAKHGGLHKFMNWDGPMLTDSGGFQIFSLGHGSVADEIKGKSISKNRNRSLLKISEEGALFKSYIDGDEKLLTPEKSIMIQRKIGADIILVFDECTPFHVDKDYTSKSMERSHRWSQRSINEFSRQDVFEPFSGSSGKQALYGIIQGGIYEDLRNESIEFNLENDFFGLAIGGSLGSTKNQMYEVVEKTALKLGDVKPIHLLGIGDPKDIWKLVKCGIDTFDCVNPTRLARHGTALSKSSKGTINIKNSKNKDNLFPLEKNCECLTCLKYSKSYLHHLFKANELLGFQLLSIHNVYFINELMKYIRKAIENDTIDESESKWFEN